MITIIEHVAWTTLAAFAVWAAVWLFRPHPSLSRTLWILALIKLTFPPLLILPFAATDICGDLIENWSNAPAIVGVPTAVTTEPSTLAAGSGTITADTVHGIGAGATTRWWRLLVVVWVWGSAVQMGRLAMQAHRLISIVRQGRPPGPALTRRAASVAQACGVRCPRVRVVKDLRAPMVAWLGQDLLLWPQTWDTADESDASLCTVMAHEMSHLRRRDHWLGWLESLMLVIWWWWPVGGFIVRQLERACEACCDAFVVALYPQWAEEYARVLVESAAGSGRAPLSPLPVSGLASARSRDLQGRVRSVMAAAMHRRDAGWMTLVVVLLALPLAPHLPILPRSLAATDDLPAGANPSDRDGEQPHEKTPLWDQMAYLVRDGGRWQAENPDYAAGSGMPRYFAYEFTWGPDRTFVKGKILARDPHAVDQTLAELVVFWHPQTKTVKFHQYGLSGRIGQGTCRIRADGNEELEFSVISRDGSETMHRYVNRRTTADRFVTERRSQGADGAWHEDPPLIWSRQM